MKKIAPYSALLALIFAVTSSFAGNCSDPTLLNGEKPDYPEVSRSKGIEGTVVVEALIDEKGNVFAADIVQSVDPRLDSKTLAAVKNWKFSAATEDGKPVMKVVRIPVDFNLVDPMEKDISSMAVAKN